jgi:hypothetical protein
VLSDEARNAMLRPSRHSIPASGGGVVLLARHALDELTCRLS